MSGTVPRTAGLLRGSVPGKGCNPYRTSRVRSIKVLAENMFSERGNENQKMQLIHKKRSYSVIMHVCLLMIM